MTPGAVGPTHVFDTDQVWTLLDGCVHIHVGDDDVTLASGDTMVIPADTRRQIFADPHCGMSAIVCAAAGSMVVPDTPDANAPACASVVGNKFLPDWIA
ncbi:cupin domain-containing protein [Skermania sp. ID1734]|uniref:cupin domain-containing protein n=1 Tax=Skermania sp. ID1734 TaxID=2597516 RepID=UPI002103C344|nr:cupin domain-containing protein [Skermania sp. ID1734]